MPGSVNAVEANDDTLNARDVALHDLSRSGLDGFGKSSALAGRSMSQGEGGDPGAQCCDEALTGNIAWPDS